MSETTATTKYYDEWQSHEQLRESYPDAPDDASIVYAGYTYEDYSGAAIVVFVRDGKWFENDDSHCSCYGLSSWYPEETSPEALLMRQGWRGLHEAVRTRVASDGRDVQP